MPKPAAAATAADPSPRPRQPAKSDRGPLPLDRHPPPAEQPRHGQPGHSAGPQPVAGEKGVVAVREDVADRGRDGDGKRPDGSDARPEPKSQSEQAGGHPEQEIRQPEVVAQHPRPAVGRNTRQQNARRRTALFVSPADQNGGQSIRQPVQGADAHKQQPGKLAGDRTMHESAFHGRSAEVQRQQPRSEESTLLHPVSA
jgi:hypothetical protein